MVNMVNFMLSIVYTIKIFLKILRITTKNMATAQKSYSYRNIRLCKQ